jgi:hypothetical protein
LRCDRQLRLRQKELTLTNCLHIPDGNPIGKEAELGRS